MDRRDQILSAALGAFAEKGFAATTIDDVRARSGASTGSIYHHFGDKEGLAAHLYVGGLRDYQEGFLARLRRAPDAEQAVKGIVRQHLTWIEQNAELARFIFGRRETEVMAATEEPMRELNRELFAQSKAILAPWFEDGSLRRVPLDVFHSLLLGPGQEFARAWLRGSTKTSIASARRSLAEAAWAALRGEGA